MDGGYDAYEMTCDPYTAMTGETPGRGEYPSPHHPSQIVELELFLKPTSTLLLDDPACRVYVALSVVMPSAGAFSNPVLSRQLVPMTRAVRQRAMGMRMCTSGSD